MIKVDGKEIQFSKFPNGETLVDTKVLNEAKDGCRIDFKVGEVTDNETGKSLGKIQVSWNKLEEVRE